MAKQPHAHRPAPAGGRNLPPAPWNTVRQARVANCRVFQVYRRTLRHTGDQREGDFYVIDAPDWVQVLALTPQKELILVRQWRFGVEKLSWEPPGGVMEKGESPLAAGQRELLEETGYAGKRAKIIGQAYPNPAIQNNQTHFVFVDKCVLHAPLNWDPHEELQIGKFSLTTAEKMIRRGEISHSLALNALQFLFLHLARQAQS